MIKRRQSLLAVMAVVLIGTGYLGFVYDPGEDVPGGSPLPTGVNPVSATATGATEETTVGTETTAPAAVETTEATSVPMEADGAEAAPAKKDGSDKETAPTDEAPATTEAPPATTENIPAATEVPPATTEKPAANIEDPPATPEATIRPASENFDPGDAFPPSSTATEETPHSGIYINPHTFTQPASEETAPSASEDTIPTVLSEPTSPRKSVPSFRLVMQIACFVFAAGACVDILLLAMLRKNVRDHERSGEQPMEPPTPAEVHPVPITKETVEETVCPIPGISLGKIHDIGRRDYQQDSFGQTAVLRNTGILAVLADGMGGLSGGERVSQKIVMEALTFGSTLQANQVPPRCRVWWPVSTAPSIRCSAPRGFTPAAPRWCPP